MQTKQEIKEIWQNNNKDIRFLCTCTASPEQYDVMSGKTEIGFIRLRWGIVYCEIPFAGERVYTENMDNSLQGSFNSEHERKVTLENIKNSIIRYLESDDDDYDDEEYDD